MKEQITWRIAWDRFDTTREASGIDFKNSPSMTLQEHTEDADINVIMQRFGIKDGSVLPYWPAANGIYGDLTEFPQDPTEIANIMRDAQLRFAMLPATIRQRYPTPEALFDFLSDPDNEPEARKYGLLEEKAPEPPKPEIVPPKAPEAPKTPDPKVG